MGSLNSELSLFDLSGRLALVTGSSRGIGNALARALTSVGATVVINGRGINATEAAAQSISSDGGSAVPAAFDICNEAAVAAAVDEIAKQHGPIDILVNNAGMQLRNHFHEFAISDFRRILDVNLVGSAVVTQAVVRSMLPRRAGKVVNICSVQSELGRASIVPYAASKGAMKLFTRGLCAELAPHGIQVNGLAPGYFETDLTASLVADSEFSEWLAQRTPAGRWGKVDELAGAVIFLASDASSFVNGQILYVDGGMTAVV